MSKAMSILGCDDTGALFTLVFCALVGVATVVGIALQMAADHGVLQ